MFFKTKFLLLISALSLVLSPEAFLQSSFKQSTMFRYHLNKFSASDRSLKVP